MSNRSASRQSSTAFKSNAPSRKATSGVASREPSRGTLSRQSQSLSVSTSFDYTEAGYARKASPNSSYCRQSSPSPSRSGLLNTSNSTITLTPSERRCVSCSRFAVQLDEFNSRQSTPVRRPKSRSPSPALSIISAVVATPSPPPSPAVDHRQRLVMAPTPPPFSPHQDFPYERDDSAQKPEHHDTPTHARSTRLAFASSEVDELTSTFSPTISLPSPSKPPVYPGFTPPKASPLEPLLPARRREQFSPSGTMSTLDTTFSSPDKGVWVPSSPLRGTSFNRTGCPYLTRSLSPSHQDKQLSIRVDSPKRSPVKAAPVKPIPTPVNMYDHSVVLATPSSKPARKGAPTLSDTTSLSGTHSVPAKHGSSGIPGIPSYGANMSSHNNMTQSVPQENPAENSYMTTNPGTPLRGSTMPIFTAQGTPTRQDANPTQVVFIPVQMPPPPQQQQQQQQQQVQQQVHQQFLPPAPAPVTVQYTISNDVPPSPHSYTGPPSPQRLYSPLPPSQPQYAQIPQVMYPGNVPVYAPAPAAVPVQNMVQYLPAGYNMSQHTQYPSSVPLIQYPATHGVSYAYMAAPPQPMPYMYAVPHPVDTWWMDQNRYDN